MTDKKQFELTDDVLENVIGGLMCYVPAECILCKECGKGISDVPHTVNGKAVCAECAEKLTK